MMQIPHPHRTFTINYKGKVRELCTSISVGNPTLRGEFDPHKKFISFANAIWDTGATNTVITKKVVDTLKLVPTGITKVNGFNISGEARTYLVDLILPNDVPVKNVNVLESSGEGFDVLVGMDIIQMGDLTISNAGDNTKLIFCIPPHDGQICWTEKFS